MGEWNKCTLEEVCDKILTGGTPSTRVNEYYTKGTIPWIKTKEVNFCRIENAENFITEKGILNSAAKIVPVNSVIVAMYGQGDTAGRVAINKIPLATNQACCNLVVEPVKADYEFIFYCLWNSYDELVLRKTGSAQPNLNTGLLKSFEIYLPPLPEQKAIASVLSSLDDKIDLLYRQNKTIEAMAETLFRQWFVEEAEEDWETKVSELPIEIIDGDRGKNYPKNSDLFDLGDCLFLSAKNVTINGFDFKQCQFITAEKDAILRSGKLNRNDIVITTRGTVGNIAYYDDLICFSDIRINSGMIIIRTDSKIVDPIFIFCLIRSDYFKSQIENQVSGSAQPQLPIRDFKQIDVYYPVKKNIDKFLSLAKPCLNKKFHNDSQIKKLEKLRDTLLPKLMSGEVRVEYEN